MINIYFYLGNTETELTSITLPSQPWKVGEVINIKVKNNNKEKWNIEDKEFKTYKIINIGSDIEVDYSISKHQFVSFIIELEEIPFIKVKSDD